MKFREYWIILISIAAIFIMYFLGIFPLGLFFTLSFFSLMILLYSYLTYSEYFLFFIKISENEIVKKIVKLTPYLLTIFGSVIILFWPPQDIKIYNTSIGMTFYNLSLSSILKNFIGIYFLTIMPGYSILNNFLNEYRFTLFEKMGLIIALSYFINSLIGLTLTYLHLLSTIGVVVSLLVFTSITIIFNYFQHKNFNSTTESSNFFETLLFILISFILVLGSYGMVLFAGPLAGITSGDIASYMSEINDLFQLSLPQVSPWLLSYIKIGNILTGLPFIYVYSSIQFLVLIIPCSVYLFMKTLFYEENKIAVVSAYMVSLLYGMSSFPFLIKLISIPSMFKQYMIGDVNLPIRKFTDIFYANTQSSVLWNRTLEFGLFFLSMAFIFRYITNYNEPDLKNLFLGVLFLNAALFTHSLFLTLVAIGTIMIFSLIHEISKKRLFNVGIVFLLFCTIMNFISNSYIEGALVTQYLYIKYQIPGISNPNINILFILFLIILIYFIILLKKSLLYKLIEIVRLNILRKKELMEHKFDNFNIKYWFFGLIIVIFAIIMSIINYDYLHLVSMNTLQPWYVWIVYWGLYIPLILGGLPYLLRHKHKTSIKFLIAIIFTLIAIFIMFSFIPALSAQRSHYLFFMSYPLSFISSIILVNIFPLNDSKNKYQNNIRKTIIMNKQKIYNYILSFILIFSITTSFLSFSLGIISYYPINKTIQSYSSSDTNVFQWIYNSLPSNNTIVTLSRTSYQRLCSIYSGKVLPIFLYDVDPLTETWPRSIIANAKSPEIILYSLRQLGATHIFISSVDRTLLHQSNNLFFSLINYFPITYSFNETTLYEIPYLHDNSNYHFISGLWDFPSLRYDLEYSRESTPLIITDDNQTGFWSVNPLDEGLGKIGIPKIYDDVKEKSVGSNSLSIKIDLGTYRRWQIQHIYSSPNDWSGKDVISLFWYGTNTGNTLSIQVQSHEGLYFARYDISDNWNGWKRVIFSIRSPSTVNGELGDILNNVDGIFLGFWLSPNVAGEFHLDHLIVDVYTINEKIVEEKPNYLQVTELLLNAKIPYNILFDDSLFYLTPNQVYLFPYNPSIRRELLINFRSQISQGAHIVFFDPTFASNTEIGEKYDTQINMLDLAMTLYKSPPDIKKILFNGTSFECESRLLYKISFKNSENLDVIAYYKISNETSSPYIINEKIGNGSITLVYLNPLESLQYIHKLKIFNETASYLLNFLPRPKSVSFSQLSPIPIVFFDKLAFRGSTFDLWQNKKLQNNLLISSDLEINGNFIISSDLMYLNYPHLRITEMQITQKNQIETLRDEVLYDVQIMGQGESKFENTIALFHNYPGGIYNLITVTLSNTSKQTLTINNAKIRFISNSKGGEISYLQCNVTITIKSMNEFNIRIKQPTISIEGSIKGKILGGIIYEQYYFYDKALEEHKLLGEFMLKIFYSSGSIISEIDDITSISWR